MWTLFPLCILNVTVRCTGIHPGGLRFEIPTPVLRILVVDDDAQFRRTLRLGLNAHGYEVGDAADGKEALSALASSVPDLVVLDWQLPGMDGIQTCRMLRLSSDVPVIVASGNRSNSKEAALEAGANDYLAKPFSLNQLLIRIQAVLKD